MDTMGSRIAQIVESNGLKKVEFARRLGIDQSYVTKLLKGEKFRPSDALIKSICREFNVSEDWLRTGNGEMCATVPDDEIAATLRRFGLPMELHGLFARYGRLSEQAQEEVRAMIHEWASEIVHEEQSLPAAVYKTTDQTKETPEETQDKRIEREAHEEAEEYYRLRLVEKRQIAKEADTLDGTGQNSSNSGVNIA